MTLNRPRTFVLAAAAALATTIPSSPSAQAPSATEALSLAATPHPPLPQDPFELWLAPTDAGRRAGTAVARFSTGIRLHGEARYKEALPLLSALPSDSVLGDYALYYTGLTQARLARVDQAEATFALLLARPLTGYLTEGARLAAAEAAESRGDYRRAAVHYRQIAGDRPLNPADVLMRLARVLEASGDRAAAAATWMRVYYEHPLTTDAQSAALELDRTSGWSPLEKGSARYVSELTRAERLFTARRVREAHEAFARLLPLAEGDDRELIAVRTGAAEHQMKRYAAARATLEPFLRSSGRRDEAQFYYLSATREAGHHAEYVRLSRELVAAFPGNPWAEEALNNLASHFIRVNEDDRADGVFREMLERFPNGRFAPRAAWRAGWWSYKKGEYADTIRIFEEAAARFPRSDYRPPWLYWSARSHDRAGRRSTAHERYALVVTDYANTYYGRLAARMLEERKVALPSAPDRLATSAPGDRATLPPTESVIRALIAQELYEDALKELQYAQQTWGDSAAIQATLGLVHSRRGELRRGINAMKRAYPQYMAAGGERLPDDLLKVLFPVAYWDLIRKHSSARGLDPYLVAALVAQESTFDPAIRSSANAVGLMQVTPPTGRRYAARAGIRNFRPAMLTNPEINVRLGTTIFADVTKRFGGTHLALASYNAGETPVVRWIAERKGFDREEFIDDIPYPETQNYVKKIVGTADDYRRLYGSRATAQAGGAVTRDQSRPAVTAKPAPRSTPAPQTRQARTRG